jgi:hypothetical protein
MVYTSAGRDAVGPHTVTLCIHNPENTNDGERVTKDAHYCMVVLLQQYGLCWLTFVIENFNSLRFLIFVMKVRVTGT